MYLERKQDLSVYYNVKDLFSLSPQINVVDEFPTTNLVLPTVAIEAKTIDPYKFELGNQNRIKYRTWYIDVFAQNKSQRDEMAYMIMNELEECIPVYDYDEGFPPETSPTRLGCLDIDGIHLEIIRINPYLVDTLYFRATVSFSAIYNTI
jgi:hypothetical protein